MAPTTPTLLSVSVGGTGACPEELWTRWAGSVDDVDGALVGGASLDPDSFAAIVRYWV